jgi:hypothetical protein
LHHDAVTAIGGIDFHTLTISKIISLFSDVWAALAICRVGAISKRGWGEQTQGQNGSSECAVSHDPYPCEGGLQKFAIHIDAMFQQRGRG